jgi:hypothetical protein
MSTISLRLPESLHKQAPVLAEREKVSINQLIATALAEKMSALLTAEYLEARTAHGKRARFKKTLARVANREPAERDRL